MFTSTGHPWPVSIKSSIIGLSTKNTHLKLNQFWLIAHSVVQRVTYLSLSLKMEQRSVAAIKWPQLMLFKLKRDIVSQNKKTTLTKNTFNVLQPIFWDSQDQFSGLFSTLYATCISISRPSFKHVIYHHFWFNNKRVLKWVEVFENHSSSSAWFENISEWQIVW